MWVDLSCVQGLYNNQQAVSAPNFPSWDPKACSFPSCCDMQPDTCSKSWQHTLGVDGAGDHAHAAGLSHGSGVPLCLVIGRDTWLGDD